MVSSTKGRAEIGEEDEEEGAVGPVFEKRGQEEESTATTQCCDMVVFVFPNHTAVILTRRSSSHPRGVRMESPDLFAALFDLVAYG